MRCYCAYCLTNQPAPEHYLFANGSNIMCDRCWLKYKCLGWFTRLWFIVYRGPVVYPL